jgi:hypothetical protein
MHNHSRERIKEKKDKLAIIRSAENSQVTLGPNQTIDITGYFDKEIEYEPTCAMLQQSELSLLPDYIDFSHQLHF